MGRLVVAFVLLGSMTAFGQLRSLNGFRKNKYNLYEMTFSNVKDAILKYNYVSDKNGADTSGYVYNIMDNPIDFAFFKTRYSGDNVFVSILFSEGDKYKIMFGEIPADDDASFFDIIDGTGEVITLVYKKP
jgi:hypothetical protein